MLITSSAWRRVSKRYKQPHGRLSAELQLHIASRRSRSEVFQITTAILASDWAQTLRWTQLICSDTPSLLPGMRTLLR